MEKTATDQPVGSMPTEVVGGKKTLGLTVVGGDTIVVVVVDESGEYSGALAVGW